LGFGAAFFGLRVFFFAVDEDADFLDLLRVFATSTLLSAKNG
jgi:hypothetical protein